MSGQSYFIRSLTSGKYLDAEQSLNNNVIHCRYHGWANQQWQVAYIEYEDSLFDLAPEELWWLHYMGMARNFNTEGSATVSISWSTGQRSDSGANIIINN